MNDERNNPEHWKLGLFYFNPNDKRILVPKKIKLFGWTLNFAHPFAIPSFILILISLALLSRVK